MPSDLAGLKEDNRQNIQQLKGLVFRHPIDRKPGPIEDKILKLLVFWDQQIPGTQVRIGEIRESLKEFAHRQKEGRKFAQKNYAMRRNGIKQVASDLRLMASSDFPLGETDDFEGSYFMGFWKNLGIMRTRDNFNSRAN